MKGGWLEDGTLSTGAKGSRYKVNLPSYLSVYQLSLTYLYLRPWCRTDSFIIECHPLKFRNWNKSINSLSILEHCFKMLLPQIGWKTKPSFFLKWALYFKRVFSGFVPIFNTRATKSAPPSYLFLGRTPKLWYKKQNRTINSASSTWRLCSQHEWEKQKQDGKSLFPRWDT